jgi:hypothetical protein
VKCSASVGIIQNQVIINSKRMIPILGILQTPDKKIGVPGYHLARPVKNVFYRGCQKFCPIRST